MADRTDPAFTETRSESTMCTVCLHGGFCPDDLEGGICSGCKDTPAICAGCKWETTRGELNEDLLCTRCESGTSAEAA